MTAADNCEWCDSSGPVHTCLYCGDIVCLNHTMIEPHHDLDHAVKEELFVCFSCAVEILEETEDDWLEVWWAEELPRRSEALFRLAYTLSKDWNAKGRV